MRGGAQRGTGPRLTDSAEVCIRATAQHEPPPEANVKVVLISRTGLHVIVAVLGFAILGCICALAYSFGNYSKLKANVEHVRSYITYRRVQVGPDHLYENSIPGGAATDVSRSATSKTPVLAVSGTGSGSVPGSNRDLRRTRRRSFP